MELKGLVYWMAWLEGISAIKLSLPCLSADSLRSILPLRSLKEVRVLEKVAEGS